MMASLPPLAVFSPRGTVTGGSVTQNDGARFCARHRSRPDSIRGFRSCDSSDGSFQEIYK
jgi:hypothetical protein